MQKIAKIGGVVSLILVSLLTSCGGGSSNGDTGTNPNPSTGGGTNSNLRAKFAACPVTNQSSDAVVTKCVAGTYNLKTLDGKDCTLTLNADGSYIFKSPAMSYNYTPTANSFMIFSHADLGSSTHQVIWSMNDHIGSDNAYNINVMARFGSQLSASEQYLEVRAEKHNSTSVTCKVGI